MALLFTAATRAVSEPVILVGYVQPLLMVIALGAWAWLVATKLDKDAMYFHLPRRKWSVFHLVVAVAAIVVYLFIPQVATGSSYWLNVPVLILLLAVSPLGYMVARNKKVPEEQRFSFSLQGVRQAMQHRRMAKAMRSASLSFKMADGTMYQTPPRDDPAYAVHLGAEEMLLAALDNRATNITLGPSKEGEYAMMTTVDGLSQRTTMPESAPPSDIITYFKQLGRLDAGDRRRRQRAIIKAIRGAETRELKLVTDGSGAGMRLSVTIDPTKQVNLKIDDLGLLSHQREIWDRITSSANGIVLIAGGLHQGRTNAMFSLIESHDAYLTNVQTLEIEEQRLIEGVRHNVFDPATEDSDFWTTLRAIMRRDPDVMGIAEMVDAQTAVQIAQAGLDGPRMYFSLRADNALQGLQVYMKAVDDPELAAAGLIGLIGIRLMRRLCETCRVPYQPTEEAIRKLNLPAGRVKQLHKAGGKVILKGHNPETCPECGGSGYLGQTGVYEILEIGEEERQLISNKDLQGLRAVLRKKKGMFIPDVALAKVIEGTTSIEEVNRVLRSAGSAKKRRSGTSESQKKA